MTYEVHIVNTHPDETGFMMSSANVPHGYQEFVKKIYEKFYEEEEVLVHPAKIEFNTDSHLWKRIIKIQSFESVSKARLFVDRWAHRPELSPRLRGKAKEMSGCSLDILIVDENGTVAQNISADELYGKYAKNKGENKPTNG